MACVTVENAFDAKATLRCDALVDTGASALVLPSVWRDRLGVLESVRTVRMETADQRFVEGDVCGPVRIQIEGFEAVFSEVIFMDMQAEDGVYEPLLGYILLEQSRAAVDMVNHRLVLGRPYDLKRF